MIVTGATSTTAATWSIDIPESNALTAKLGLDVLKLTAFGHIDSSGSFSFTLQGHLDLTWEGNGLVGEAHAHVALRQRREDLRGLDRRQLRRPRPQRRRDQHVDRRRPPEDQARRVGHALDPRGRRRHRDEGPDEDRLGPRRRRLRDHVDLRRRLRVARRGRDLRRQAVREHRLHDPDLQLPAAGVRLRPAAAAQAGHALRRGPDPQRRLAREQPRRVRREGQDRRGLRDLARRRARRLRERADHRVRPHRAVRRRRARSSATSAPTSTRCSS